MALRARGLDETLPSPELPQTLLELKLHSQQTGQDCVTAGQCLHSTTGEVVGTVS